MKKLLSLLIVLATVFSVASCNNSSNEEIKDTVTVDSTVAVSKEIVEYSEIDLEKFVILYEDTRQNDIAKELRDKIQEKTGVVISIKRYKSAGPASEYEFLLDASHRSLSKDFAALDFKESCVKYGYIIEDGKIFLAGYDLITVRKSIDLFLSAYVTDSTVIKIENKVTNLVNIDFEKEKIPANVADGQIRVMSNNVIRAKYATPEFRIKDLKVAYAMLDADVISLQECGKTWLYTYGLIDTLKTIGYELVPFDNEECSNPMFYRTETLKLIDSGDVQYENNNTDNDAYRSYAWGYFEQISTGKKFIATSTHLSPDDSSLRRGSAKQLSDELEKMSTEYGAPAIMLGDYNSRVSADAYGTMKIKFHSARDKAQTRVNMSISTFLGDINQPIMPGTSVLDHCFYSKKGLTATHFETVASKYASVYTDHLAIICDFIID